MAKIRRKSGWVRLLVIAVLFLGVTPSARAEFPGSLDILAAQLSSPESLESFMKKNFRYVKDTALFDTDEYWQSADEMLLRKAGDCEDFAVFAREVLERNGYAAFILSLYWDDNAHTVAVFEKDGMWGIFNLDKLSYVSAHSMEDLGKAVRRSWNYLGIMRQENHTGIISRKFTKDFAKEPIRVSLPVTEPVSGPYVYRSPISSQQAFYPQLSSQKPQPLHQAL
jgi:hypothetical protein